MLFVHCIPTFPQAISSSSFLSLFISSQNPAVDIVISLSSPPECHPAMVTSQTKKGPKLRTREKTGLLDPFFRFWSTLPEGLGCRWSKSGSWKVLFALSQATDSILPVTLMAISARSLDPNPQLVDFPPLNSVKYVKLKTKTKQSVRECSGFQLRSTWTTICVRCYLCISASQK